LKKSKANSYLNWISADASYECEARLYGLLFTVEKPGDMDNYLDYMNKDSEKVFKNVKVHKGLLDGLSMDSRFQFERKGFFCLDKDSDIANGKLVWNETVGLVERKK
jgi:glutaminyl-tRNA synthetase